ncbi:hypothetical protein K469DRAFT_755900 [Zopfia rhizophila CBS 207.26]|uniref:BED-type domain-containing protein n=1 Tax=Zopfia rhizophila CBS 207.26 TaxID=1314779 RepID=A0A6A6D946_9PEZI|nr:hypothetical protein K469DRAFT_756386 [Zopfia rhizophila CBS 207.26]KAF2176054.1 hypothetical protein K469DRAFT_755900 [Zopfia rhizophila CBS 207.26]
MSLHHYFHGQHRSSRSRTVGQSYSSNSSYQPYHAASSKQLEKARAVSPILQSSSTEPTPSSASTLDSLSQEFPEDSRANQGVHFEVDWDNIWRGRERLKADRLGYRVKHKSQLRGSRQISEIWNHGADLLYHEENGSRTKIWLCKICHLQGLKTAAKFINGNAHVSKHLLKDH